MKKTEAGAKAERILNIYYQLANGSTVEKEEMANLYHVNMRTIQRDISDINSFLKERIVAGEQGNEVVYNRTKGGYQLEIAEANSLTCKEVLVISKVLLESRSLVKEELEPIVKKLLKIAGNKKESKTVDKLLKNEMFHYNELHHKSKVLDKLWTIATAVNEQKYVEIEYQSIKKKIATIKTVKPVGIMFSEFYFYFVAFIKDIDKEKDYENPNDAFPTIYRVDRVKEITILPIHFSVPYRDKFEEGEFRKRIQFMYGGKLEKMKFSYQGLSIEAVLDKLPTAKIISETEGVFVIEVEVYGKGIDMWIRSQGDDIKVIERRYI